MAYSRKPSMVANCAIIKNINLRNFYEENRDRDSYNNIQH